jgi:alanine racemase
MTRLGVSPSEAPALARRILGAPGLQLAGVYTHLSSAEDDPEFTRNQIALFRDTLRRFEAEGIRVPSVHLSNSAALLHEQDAIFNMVRPGLLVYGIVPPGKRATQSKDLERMLRPALSLKCRISFVKQIVKGTPVSYGHSYSAPRTMRVGTLSAGYGDGYMRSGSNRAEVLVKGLRCSILGKITMDQMMVDLSSVPSAEIGDEAVLIGRQGEDEITAAELARWCGTIPWEVLTNITYRVPRLYRGSEAA